MRLNGCVNVMFPADSAHKVINVPLLQYSGFGNKYNGKMMQAIFANHNPNWLSSTDFIRKAVQSNL